MEIDIALPPAPEPPASLTSIAALRAGIGSLDRVARIAKVVGWVNSAPGSTRQPGVINGASDLLIERVVEIAPASAGR